MYDFIWSEFCDWYIEMAQGPAARTTASAADWPSACSSACSTRILRLVHPVMPFVAESIWQALNEAAFERGLPTPRTGGGERGASPLAGLPASVAATRRWRRASRRMQELVRVVREVRNRYSVDAEDAARRDRALRDGGGGRLPGAGAVHHAAGRRRQAASAART